MTAAEAARLSEAEQVQLFVDRTVHEPMRAFPPTPEQRKWLIEHGYITPDGKPIIKHYPE